MFQRSFPPTYAMIHNSRSKTENGFQACFSCIADRHAAEIGGRGRSLASFTTALCWFCVQFFEFLHSLSKSTGQEPAHPAADDSLSWSWSPTSPLEGTKWGTWRKNQRVRKNCPYCTKSSSTGGQSFSSSPAEGDCIATPVLKLQWNLLNTASSTL